MPSHNAKAVAHEVIENVRKGTKVNLGKIAQKHGYSKSVAQHPKKITQTQSFKIEMVPILDELSNLRKKAIDALQEKDLGKSSVGELTLLLRNLNRDIVLIGGGEENNKKRIILLD